MTRSLLLRSPAALMPDGESAMGRGEIKPAETKGNAKRPVPLPCYARDRFLLPDC